MNSTHSSKIPPNILVFTTSEGHRSIGEAVTAYLEKEQFQVQYHFIEERGLFFYRFFYKYLPQMFGFIFKLSNNLLVNFFLQNILFHEHFHELKRQIEVQKPSLVINTSFGFTPALLALKNLYDFTFINILPNPRSFFRQDIAFGADCLCVFDEKTEQDVRKYPQFPQIIQTGWFVRPQFETEYDITKVREKLGLQKNLLTFLFVTGSEGTESILHTVRAISEMGDIQCIVACGHNQKLVSTIQNLAEEANAKIVALKFTKEIYLYMQAADLVVGKAGPNMIFESAACSSPFFATTHVGGLEDGNIELIQEYDIGFVEEDPEKATALLKSIIQSPQRVEEKLMNVKKLAAYNKTQRKTLIEYLHSKLT